jgi:hypothetical protein
LKKVDTAGKKIRMGCVRCHMKRKKGEVVGQYKKYQCGDAQCIHTFDHPLFMAKKKVTTVGTFKASFTMGISDLDKFITLMTTYDLITHFPYFPSIFIGL